MSEYCYEFDFWCTWAEGLSAPLWACVVRRPSVICDSRSSHFTFPTSFLKPLNGVERNFVGSKILTSSAKFVFSGQSKKHDGRLASDWLGQFRLLLWNRWTEFNESWQGTKTTKFLFLGRSEKQDGSPASDWLRHYKLFLWTSCTEFNETWLEARSQHYLPKFCFSGSEKQDGCPDLWLAEAISTSSLKPLNRIQRIDRKQDLIVRYKLCASWPIGNPKWPSRHLTGCEIFDFFFRNQRNMTGSKIAMSSTTFVCCFFFFGWGGGADQKTRMEIMVNPSTKLAHCTHVHNMWPFYNPFSLLKPDYSWAYSKS